MFSKKNEEGAKEEKPFGIGEKIKKIFKKKTETPETKEIDLEKIEIKVNKRDEIAKEEPEKAEEREMDEVKEIAEVPNEEIPEERIEPEKVKEASKEEEKEVKKKERHKKEEEIPEEDKAVGEILTEKHEEEMEIEPDEIQKEVAGTKVKIEQEIDLEKILMDTEKLRVELDVLKEIKFNADERIKELAESIGEVRSLIFQNDAAGKEIEIKVNKMDEIVSDLKPEKIMKKLQEREQAIEQTQIRVEKLEAMNADLIKKVLSAEKALANIKSLENLMEIVKDIDEKVLKINELKSSTERDSAKAERFYMEMGKGLEEFGLLKERLERLEELNKELVRGVDENTIKLENAVTKDELRRSLETALKPPEFTESVEELRRRGEEITTLLKQLELQYKEGIISKGSYEEIVEKNKGILERIENDIKDVKTKERPTNLIAWVAEIEDELKNFKTIGTQEKKTELSKSLEEIKIQVSGINEELEKQKSVIEYVLGLKEGKSLSSEDEKKTKEVEKQAVKNLLENLEDDYREGTISEKTYMEARDKNLEIMGGMKNQLITKVGELERKIEELEQKRKHNPIVIE